MRPYEITYIVRPDLDDEQTRGVAESITQRLRDAGAEITVTYPLFPGRRRLAYPIRDFGDGFYVTSVFQAEPTILRDFESALRLNENILRFLITEASQHTQNLAQQRAQQPVSTPAESGAQPEPAQGAQEGGQQPAPVPAGQAENTPPAEAAESAPVAEAAGPTEAQPAPEPTTPTEPQPEVPTVPAQSE